MNFNWKSAAILTGILVVAIVIGNYIVQKLGEKKIAAMLNGNGGYPASAGGQEVVVSETNQAGQSVQKKVYMPR